MPLSSPSGQLVALHRSRKGLHGRDTGAGPCSFLISTSLAGGQMQPPRSPWLMAFSGHQRSPSTTSPEPRPQGGALRSRGGSSALLLMAFQAQGTF